jgi:hypothetical protein
MHESVITHRCGMAPNLGANAERRATLQRALAKRETSADFA